ncbi:hypothetical protein ACTXT7_008687 [Hymenolepis weldensis]
MLKEACNVTLPSPECLLPNYTVPWDDNMPLSQVNGEIYYVTTVVTGTPITIIGLITSIVCILVFSIYPITQKTTRYLLIINSVEDTLYLTLLSLVRLIGVMLRLGANSEYYYNNSLDTIAKRNTKYTSKEKSKSAVSKRKSEPAVELNATTNNTSDK